MWISVEFKRYLFKEFQRPKDQELNHLLCLSNLDTLNAHFIEKVISQNKRLEKLNTIAINQVKIVVQEMSLKNIYYSGKLKVTYEDNKLYVI